MLSYADIGEFIGHVDGIENLKVLARHLHTEIMSDQGFRYNLHKVYVWDGTLLLLFVEVCVDTYTGEESLNRVEFAPEEEWENFFMKQRQILNLTQHKASPEQVEAGVVEPCCKEVVTDLLTFNDLPVKEDILERAEQLAEIAEECHYSKVMIGGALWLMGPLEEALERRGIQPLYAYSVRNCVEEPQPDGSIKKTMVFKHLGFIEA